MDGRVAVSIAGGVADVRLDRPEKLNALDDAMFEALRQAAARLRDDRRVRAVVLSGEGRGFCAGLDTDNFGRMATGERTGAHLVADARSPRGANPSQQAVLGWREIGAPVIAAVHGVALGGGFQLALGADLRFVAPDARLSMLEVKWGLVPDMGGVALLRGLLRDDVARDLAFTGRMVSGTEALALGLVTRLCADPRAEALAYARELAEKSPDALRAAKRLFDLAQDADEAAILRAESEEQAALMGSPNQREAVAAALERRPARFAD